MPRALPPEPRRRPSTCCSPGRGARSTAREGAPAVAARAPCRPGRRRRGCRRAPLRPAGAEAAGPAATGRRSATRSLSELERCGYRFYLERVLRAARGPRRSARRRRRERGLEARARGTLVHRLMETVDFAAAPAAARPRQVAARGRRAGAARRDEDERDEIAELARRGRAAQAGRPAGAAPATCGASTRSRSRSAPREPLLTRRHRPAGRRAGRRRCWSSTTRATGSGRRRTWTALVEREYGVQRLLYALAVLRAGRAARGGRALVPGSGPSELGRRPLRGAEQRAGLERRWRARSRARRGSGVRGQPAAPPGAVPDLPGARGPVLLGRGGDAARAPRGRAAGGPRRRPRSLSGCSSGPFRRPERFARAVGLRGSLRCYAFCSASGARLPAPRVSREGAPTLRGMHRPKGALP